MSLEKWLSKPNTGFRFRSIGLQLASPLDIKSWAFYRDPNGRPFTGEIKNERTVSYKTLKPEPGGLFCTKVFGPDTGKKERRSKSAYLDLGVPLAHIWYLKGSPSYLAIILKHKRRMIQRVIYTEMQMSFPFPVFEEDDVNNPIQFCHIDACSIFNPKKTRLFSSSFYNTTTDQWPSSRFFHSSHLMLIHSLFESWGNLWVLQNSVFQPKRFRLLQQPNIDKRVYKPYGFLITQHPSIPFFVKQKTFDIFPANKTLSVFQMKSEEPDIKTHFWEDFPVLLWKEPSLRTYFESRHQKQIDGTYWPLTQNQPCKSSIRQFSTLYQFFKLHRIQRNELLVPLNYVYNRHFLYQNLLENAFVSRLQAKVRNHRLSWGVGSKSKKDNNQQGNKKDENEHLINILTLNKNVIKSRQYLSPALKNYANYTKREATHLKKLFENNASKITDKALQSPLQSFGTLKTYYHNDVSFPTEPFLMQHYYSFLYIFNNFYHTCCLSKNKIRQRRFPRTEKVRLRLKRRQIHVLLYRFHQKTVKQTIINPFLVTTQRGLAGIRDNEGEKLGIFLSYPQLLPRFQFRLNRIQPIVRNGLLFMKRVFTWASLNRVGWKKVKRSFLSSSKTFHFFLKQLKTKRLRKLKPLKKVVTSLPTKRPNGFYRCFSVLLFQSRFSVRLNPTLTPRPNSVFVLDSFQYSQPDDLFEFQLNKEYIEVILRHRFPNRPFKKNQYYDFEKRNQLNVKNQVVCLFPTSFCSLLPGFGVELVIHGIKKIAFKKRKRRKRKVTTCFVYSCSLLKIEKLMRAYYNELVTSAFDELKRFQTIYPLPKPLKGSRPQRNDPAFPFNSNIFSKTFTITYIPLSCRYIYAPKNLHLIPTTIPANREELPSLPELMEKPYTCFEWPHTYSSFKRLNKRQQKPQLRNPLGHRAFRKVLKQRFKLSIQKSVLMGQLKMATKHLCSQKTHDAFGLSFTTKHAPKRDKSLTNQLKALVKFEKNKVLYFFLMQFYYQFSKRTPKNKGWWLTLIKHRFAFFPMPTKLCFLCFGQRAFYLKYFSQRFSPYSSQKSHFYYEPFRTQLTFPYRLLKNFYKKLVRLQPRHRDLNKIFSLAYDFQKKTNRVSRWKTESLLFYFLHRKKRVLNSATSMICHKLDLFIGVLKPRLLTDPLWLNLKTGLTERILKNRHVKDWDSHAFLRAELVLNAKNKELKRIFDLLNVSAVANPFDMAKRLQQYVSLKTKLIKAKKVRFLIAYFLLGTKPLDEPSLNDLLWFFTLNAQRVQRLNNYDNILYSRCVAHHKVSQIKGFKQEFFERLISFFKLSNRLGPNKYAVLRRSFAWEIPADFQDTSEYLHPQPDEGEMIVPAYMTRCFTWQQPTMGAWSIQILLKRFKAKPSISSYLFNKVGTVNCHLLMRQYRVFLATQIESSRHRLVGYQNWYQLLHIRALPQKLLRAFFKSNEIPFTARAKIMQRYRLLIDRLRATQLTLTRRYKILRPFFPTHSDPAWLILNVFPILPPDLRPLLLLESGQFATSDLNLLYQQLIQRVQYLTNRAYSANPRKYPFLYTGIDQAIKFRVLLAQKAVDAVLDNGKSDSQAVLNTRGQPLKSLSDMLRGKKGRFRQNLLGKRVDYSGRSVIVVGPQLKVNECGLPREMALELFQPFLIRFLIQNGYHRTFTRAKKWIRQQKPNLWFFLEKVIRNRPILLNRAPTLHRLGIQAFQPKLVAGRTILLHPLVCSAFNADFDGDQMAVHVPLSYEACSEAWRIMWSRNQLFSPATGEPVLMPTQDMVLGCYYLSTLDKFKQKNQVKKRLEQKHHPNAGTNERQQLFYTHWFTSMGQVLHFLALQKISVHQAIWLKWSHPFECQQLQTCLEFQLEKRGHCFEYYPEYQKISPRQFDNHIWIKTTPGRVIMNDMFFRTMEL